MLGTVRNVDGTNQPFTIAGLSDGSTDIVHRECNEEYQIPMAVDCQYGAGYLGITDCCKFLFNPATGVAKVHCIETTVTCVDINNNSNIGSNQPILAQGFNEDGLYDNSVEKTAVVYNANCYLCNDPTTGDPVCKPVLHIGTACIDELLGVEQGATVECWCCGTNTNEGNILFTCDDGTGTTIYYDTALSYNAIGCVLASRSVATQKISPYNYDNYNEAYIMLGKCYVAIAGNSRDNCAPQIRVSNDNICVNGCSYPIWIGNSNAHMNIAANGNTSITAPSFSISATCTYMSLPNALTCVNLMARDHVSGQVVEVPEVVYNPTTCELCGKFIPTGGIAVCPTTTSAWYNIVINCATADGLKYSDISHRIAADPDTGRIFASGGLTSDGGPVIKAESTNELNIYPTSGDAVWINYRGGAVNTYIGNGSASSNGYGNIVANRAIADLQGRIMMDCNLCANVCSFMPYSGTRGVYGIKEGDWGHFLTFSHGDFNTYYGTAVQVPFWDCDRWYWRTRENGSLCGVHALLDDRGGQRVYGDFYLGCNNYYVQRNGVDQPVALVCDMPSGSNSREIDPNNAVITSVVGMINNGETVFVNGHIAADTTTFGGQPITIDYLLGYAHRQNENILFTGNVRQYGTSKALHATLWISSSYGVEPTWSSIQRPGTLYGSASSSGINVEGTV